MRKHLYIIIGLLMSVSLYAQHDLGSLNIRIGANSTVGATFTNGTILGISAAEDTGGVVAVQLPVSLDFGLTKFLSIHAGFQTGSWLNEDPNDNTIVIKKKKVSSALIGFKLYAINKENFNLYLAYDLGIGSFETEKENSGFFLVNEKQKWSGTSNNINLGMNWYYGGGFGSYFQLGYAGYNFDIKEYSLNNQANQVPNQVVADMVVKGVQLELGLCYKFGK
jgi:hypothetical protein